MACSDTLTAFTALQAVRDDGKGDFLAEGDDGREGIRGEVAEGGEWLGRE